MDGWHVIYFLFKRISVISGPWVVDNERLCAMKPHLWTIRSLPEAGLGQSSPRSVPQILVYWATWPRGYKAFFMLNSVEHEILNAHKYKKYQEIRHFLGSDKPKMLFYPFINVKIVGILTFMSRKNFILSWVEHKKSFITSGLGS